MKSPSLWFLVGFGIQWLPWGCRFDSDDGVWCFGTATYQAVCP